MKFLCRSDFHYYQEHAYAHVLQHPGAGLFMEMGLGKTVIALTAADYFLNDSLEITRVLIIAPKKVIQSVWRQEAARWEHLKHLRFSTVMGTEKQRKEALKVKADIYLVNRENVPWLVALAAGRWRFDMVIIDESSSFKNHEAKRFRAMQSTLPAVKRRLILTGTPMPQNYLDIWSQVFILDEGKRLGDSFYRFRDKYFSKDPWKQFTYNLVSDSAEKEISESIKDICISLQEKDYLKLPPRIDRTILIEFTPEQQKAYDDFEEDEILNLPNEQEISALNSAGLTNKLLQFANGAVYDNKKNYHVVHDEKLDRLSEIVEDANGHPVLVAYTYQSDYERMKQRFPQLRKLETDKDIREWNEGKIEIAALHPASGAYGLNLQAGGNIIVWFGLPWNLEWYLQFNKRLHRQGQKEAVIIHHLLMKGTMDEDVMAALVRKATSQEGLMEAVKARIAKYKKVA